MSQTHHPFAPSVPFFESHPRAEITSLALSSNRRYLAVGERGERPALTIFDVSSIGLAAPGSSSGMADQQSWQLPIANISNQTCHRICVRIE
jgi:hypothetical protein